MQYILEVAGCGNFTRASKNLFISQPALSRSIIQLENSIGIRIFNRIKNLVELTPEGAAICAKARQLIVQYNDFNQMLEKIAKEKLTAVSLGITPYYSNFYLPMITCHIKKTHPDIVLSIVEDEAKNLREMIRHHQLDLGVFVESPDSDDITYDLLYREKVFLAVPRNYPLEGIDITKPVNLRLFKDTPFILMKNKNTFNELCNKICDNAGFEPIAAYRLSNWETACAMIAQGAGVGFLPRISLCSMSKNTPVCLDIDTKYNSRNFSVAHSSIWPYTHQMKVVVNALVSLFQSFDPNSLQS
jgi:LysR family hydrogen peroxide-inducible transcriptional activator